VISVGFEAGAADDARAAYDWYEEQQRGLGVRFFDAVSDAVDRIAEAPHGYPEQYRGLRRILVERFPYAIYYRVYPSQVSVVAVFHGKRDPRVLHHR